jgi:hypothetical protein
MGFLERLVQKSEKRQAVRKEYEQWLEVNPDIKKEVNRLDDEAILHEAKAGVAAVVAIPMLLAGPLGLLGTVGFAAESGRQWHKGFKALKERDEIIQKNSPYRQSGTE